MNFTSGLLSVLNVLSVCMGLCLVAAAAVPTSPICGRSDCHARESLGCGLCMYVRLGVLPVLFAPLCARRRHVCAPRCFACSFGASCGAYVCRTLLCCVAVY